MRWGWEGRRCLSYADSLFSKYLWSTSVCQVLQLHPWERLSRGREPLLRGPCGAGGPVPRGSLLC